MKCTVVSAQVDLVGSSFALTDIDSITSKLILAYTSSTITTVSHNTAVTLMLYMSVLVGLCIVPYLF